MIKTWQQRCEEHPDHEGIVSEGMIRARMQEEIDELRQALAEPEQEPASVKHITQWVELLKRCSDNGKHMKIPSGMTAGACYELAIELEHFVKTAPPKREWVGLTDEDLIDIGKKYYGNSVDAMLAIEAKLKEKNT